MNARLTPNNYVEAANSRDFGQVAPFVAEDAVYWFTDGTFSGRDAIRRAFEATWSAIQDETYTIDNVRWIAMGDQTAACVYSFHSVHSEGWVEGQRFSATGRGTNVFRSPGELGKLCTSI